MNITNLFKKLKQVPKRYIVAVVAGLAIAVPIAVNAGYGPDRPVFDWNNPADRIGSAVGPVLNSFVNTPTYGDERAFVDAKNATNTNPGGFADTVDVVPGQEYTIRAYVHNNGNQDLNDAAHDFKSVATNTRVHFKVLPGVANGNEVTGYISADNAVDRNGNPLRTVFDTVKLKNDNQAFSLEYEPGSARLESNVHPFPGVALPDAITSDQGVLIGDNQDGKLSGCFDFTEIIVIKVKVVAPALQVSKLVSSVEAPKLTDSHESISAKTGDTVSWRIDYKNTGTDVDHHVVIRDALPKGLTLVPGSITLITAATPNGMTLQDTALTSGGVDVGDYFANGNGLIRFRTTIDQNPKECVITNTAFGQAENVSEQSDTATVTIENCNKPKPQDLVCNSLTKQAVGTDDRTYTFTVGATPSGGATIGTYTFDYGDSSTPFTTDQKTSQAHTYKPGSYLAKVTVNGRVDGKDKTATSATCTTPVTVSASTTAASTTTTITNITKTGPGDVAGIFAGTTTISAAGYQLVARFRRRK